MCACVRACDVDDGVKESSLLVYYFQVSKYMPACWKVTSSSRKGNIAFSGIFFVIGISVRVSGCYFVNNLLLL